MLERQADPAKFHVLRTNEGAMKPTKTMKRKPKPPADKKPKVYVKHADIRDEIRKKLQMNFPMICKTRSEQEATNMIEELTVAYVLEHENHKPSQLANANYINGISDDPGTQIGLHSNLRMYGSLNRPTENKAEVGCAPDLAHKGSGDGSDGAGIAASSKAANKASI